MVNIAEQDSLTREHGKVKAEAVMDASLLGGMAGAFAPLVADALAPRTVSGGRTTITWEPHGVVCGYLGAGLEDVRRRLQG